MWDTEIITYHHALQPMFTMAYSSNTDPMVAFSIWVAPLTYQLF